jgi:hypothetical protein
VPATAGKLHSEWGMGSVEWNFERGTSNEGRTMVGGSRGDRGNEGNLKVERRRASSAGGGGLH